MKYFFACVLALTGAQAIEHMSMADLKLLSLEERKKGKSNFSPISIEVDGKQNTYYVAAGFTSTGGSDYQVPADGRGYISTTPTLDKTNPSYFKPDLLGGSVEWDVDLSEHECGCIAAFYLVSMPGRDEAGDLWMKTDSWGYCDANHVAGNFCPEFDLMEANKHSFATTPHACNAPDKNGFYHDCDGDGHCNQNIYDQFNWDGYGPGESYTINTDLPFHVQVSFEQDHYGDLAAFTTTMTQNGRTRTMTTHDCGYLATMTENLSNGMAFVVSNWGGDAEWLWHDRCTEPYTCPWPELTVSNIKVTTGK